MRKYKYFTRLIKTGLVLTLIMALPQVSFPQSQNLINYKSLTYQQYLEMVVNHNLDYSAEKYNLNMADAKIDAARIFQNPSIAFDWEGDKNEYLFSSTLSKTFELGQKRQARIHLAQSEKLLDHALLEEYFRNLQADATLDYLFALEQNYLYSMMLNSYQTMKDLADADSIRLQLGSIKAIDAAQSKIEAGVLRNELIQLEAERKNAFLKLSTNTSTYQADTLFSPTGNFKGIDRDFVLSDLIIHALNNRSDLMAAKSTSKYLQDNLNLIRKERVTDIDFNIGSITSGGSAANPVSTMNQLYTGIAIPLKFSNLNHGELELAKYQIEQSDMWYHQIEIQIQNEVMQAFNEYNSLRMQVKNYNQGLLELAKTVLDGKVYSYTRGETSLLEVLNAQRTYNDMQTSFYETMYQCYAALVGLEKAAGIWDIDL